MVSKLAKNKDAAHQNRMKKVKPKQRFKTLSKVDQYIVTGRALADLLSQKRTEKGDKHEWAGIYVVVRQFKASYIEIDPATCLPTQSSVMKIKRALANAVKRVLGPDAAFIMAIEYQDGVGDPIRPHAQIIAIKHRKQGTVKDLKQALQKVADDYHKDTVKVGYLSKLAGYKRERERVRDEADFRRAAGYDAKNDNSRFYRSKTTLHHLPGTWEDLKAHYLKPPRPKSS